MHPRARQLPSETWIAFLPQVRLAGGTHVTAVAGAGASPVLNAHTPLNRDFDVYESMPKHNDFPAMVRRLRFDGDRPWFWLLNVGETHYPYALPDEDPSEWPRRSGVHGVFKHLDEDMLGGRLVAGEGADGAKRAEGSGFFDTDGSAAARCAPPSCRCRSRSPVRRGATPVRGSSSPPTTVSCSAKRASSGRPGRAREGVRGTRR